MSEGRMTIEEKRVGIRGGEGERATTAEEEKARGQRHHCSGAAPSALHYTRHLASPRIGEMVAAKCHSLGVPGREEVK